MQDLLMLRPGSLKVSLAIEGGKTLKNGTIIKSASVTLPQDELALINKYTRREMTADELYTFSVVLCDNEIDRDFERFSIDALHTLSELYVGKTGVFNHEAKTENQIARIYKCYVEKILDKQTQTGEIYHRLVAKAYLPITEGNKELILLLDSGIRKEVSVGCAVSQKHCSICGKSLRESTCKHHVGKYYAGKLCHTVLNAPTDAYEWSFVAVPAQREAGVIKSFRKINNDRKEVLYMGDIKKMLGAGNEVHLTAENAVKLHDYITKLEDFAEIGKSYKEDLKRDVVRLSAIVYPEIKTEIMEQLTDCMNFETLKAFKSAYGTKDGDDLICTPSLYSSKEHSEQSRKTNAKGEINNAFKI